MARLDEFLPDVLPEVPDCPAQIAERAILQSARNFCMETWAWEEPVLTKTAEPEQEAHDIPEPFDGEIVAISSVEIDGSPVPFAWPRRDQLQAKGQGELVARGALQPTLSDTELPDILAMHYSEAITAGTKYRLMRMPGVAWSNPDMAMFYQREFQQHVGRARVERVRHHTNEPQTVQPVRFV